MATLLTVLTTVQSYASRLFEGRPTHWQRLVPIQATDWYAWGLLAPVVLALATSHPWAPGRRVRLASLWAVLGLALALGHAVIEVVVARRLAIVDVRMSFPAMLSARYFETLLSNVIIVSLLVTLSYAAAQSRQSRVREQQAAELEARLAQAQLQALRQQLQPHFLFNTLNTISALVTDSPLAARRVLVLLGDLLRVVLRSDGSPEVPLSEELAFLDSYLEIQRARFGARLVVNVVAPADVERALVPHLLLQPLVENAIRHAVEPCRASVRVEVRARRCGERLLLEIQDDGPGLGTARHVPLGVGLRSTKARLAQLYGTAAAFDIRSRIPSGCRVRIEVPLRSPGHAIAPIGIQGPVARA